MQLLVMEEQYNFILKYGFSCTGHTTINLLLNTLINEYFDNSTKIFNANSYASYNM